MTDKPDNVIPLRAAKIDQSSNQKWGREVMQIGFCIIPSLLLRAQQRLGLNPTQLAILMQLADFWWEEARKPYPSKQTLSDRLGIGTRQIQRHIAELEKAGLIKRVERTAVHKGKLSNTYDLTGLVERLKKLEPEFREVKEETASLQKKVSRRGGLNRVKKETTP